MRNLRPFMIMLCCLFCVAGTFAQQRTTIQGKVIPDNIKEVNMFRIENGEIRQVAGTEVSANGFYGFLFEPVSEGLFLVGTKDIHFPVYVKPGDVVNLNIEDLKAVLTGKNSEENVKLYEWLQLSETVRVKAAYFSKMISTYRDFFPELEELAPKAETFAASVKMKNKVFESLLKQMVGYDMLYYPLLYLQTPRIEHPNKDEYPIFYSRLNAEKLLEDTGILQMPYGMRAIRTYAIFSYLQTGKSYSLDLLLSFIPNPELKANLILDDAQKFKIYEEYQNMMQKYGAYFVTPLLKAKAEAIGSPLYEKMVKEAGTKRKMAAEFTYPDRTGKKVSLSDFKGKVVVVDVWATWCGPCMQQLPFLKKLEQEMYGKDVVFIGVSLDVAKDREKWLNTLEKEKLDGIQIFADGWTKITKDYGIKAIPRFLVFSKKGEVISIDAPRPSDPALKILIEKALAE